LALRDVAKLYAKYDELYKAQPEQQAEPVAKLFGSLPVYDTTPPQQQAEPVQEPYESPYNPNAVEYQYHYPDGSWSCSNGEVINGMHPDRARSLYALKDNT
jgi:hypothetical protein